MWFGKMQIQFDARKKGPRTNYVCGSTSKSETDCVTARTSPLVYLHSVCLGIQHGTYREYIIIASSSILPHTLVSGY